MTGKRQHYELGQYFRQRYADFLPEEYSERDIFVRSTDVDRTLMSAEADLAGLYPPIKTDIWDNNLLWQPIPIHTTPENMDAVLAEKKPCKKHGYLLKQLLKNDYFRNISHTYHDLYAYLTRNSGDTISDLTHLEYLYNTFYIETLYNYTLPEWAQKVYPTKMKYLASLSFAINTYTSDLARLKTGPFFNELINYFKNRSATEDNAIYYAPKFLMFSSHDTIVANLLNSMGAFEYHNPPYTATVLFELYKSSGRSYVKVFYKNTTDARLVSVHNCESECDLEKFIEILKPITLTLEEWESECNSLLFDTWHLYLLLISLLFFVSSCGFYIFVLVRNCKSENNMYTQLPDEECA